MIGILARRVRQSVYCTASFSVLFAREKTPLPVAVSQPSPSAQLQAGRFPFLVQGKSFFTQPDDPLAAQVIEG